MINKLIINGDNISLNEETQIPFTYTFSQANVHTVKIGLDETNEICAYAFQDCKNMTYISIPEEITMIKRCAFKNCSNLPSITLHDKIEYVGKDAFAGCSKLSEINFKANTPPQWYTTIPSSTKIYVPNGSKYEEVTYDDMDMSGATQYYQQSLYNNKFRYEGYTKLDDPTLADETGTTVYYKNKWDKIADGEHTVEEKNRVAISDVAFDNIAMRIRAGETEEFTYTIGPENRTNNQLYWYSNNENIVTINTETGKEGVVEIVTHNTGASGVSSTTIVAISETTRITATATIYVEPVTE